MNETAEKRVRVFVQARMGSRRFPGKVLAPLSGKPVLGRVVDAVGAVIPMTDITIVTSGAVVDLPIVAYAEALGVTVFRGPEEDVLTRFADCLGAFPCRWILRVCADSPFQAPPILESLLEPSLREDFDLHTTTWPRSFPKGRNAELIRANTLRSLQSMNLSAEQREHVTRYFYENPDQHRIRNVRSARADLAQPDLAVDTLEDLRRLEAMVRNNEIPPARVEDEV